MIKTLITGGGGMIGQKIAQELETRGLDGQPCQITLVDIQFPPVISSGQTAVTASMEDAEAVTRLAADRPDVIFHLAAVVSGHAEKEFDVGWSANVDAMRFFLEALRQEHLKSGGTYRPRVVFASSAAVYGGPLPAVIPDDFHTAPQSSYGVQKVIGEQMVTDFSRKGFIDGLSLRLPTICVRPGKPNAAASSAFSGIIREPLNGETAVLPFPESTRHMLASPRSAVGWFTHAATLDTTRLDGLRAIMMPSLTCSIAEQIEALRQVAGDKAVALIKRQDDPDVVSIVGGWPQEFDTPRAHALGFRSETRFSDIVTAYIEDELS